MRNAEFRRIVGMESLTIGGARGTRLLETSNELLGSYVGATGVKTGWTNEAGYCLVATAKRHDVELTAVVLGTETEKARFDQARILLDWGFEHYKLEQTRVGRGDRGCGPVTDYLDVRCRRDRREAVGLGVRSRRRGAERTVSLKTDVDAPVSVGEKSARSRSRRANGSLRRCRWWRRRASSIPGVFERVWIAIVRAWRSRVRRALAPPEATIDRSAVQASRGTHEREARECPNTEAHTAVRGALALGARMVPFAG